LRIPLCVLPLCIVPFFLVVFSGCELQSALDRSFRSFFRMSPSGA